MCWIICNFSLEGINEILIQILVDFDFVDSGIARLPLDAVAHVYGLLDIVDSAQGDSNYVGDAFRVNLCMKQLNSLPFVLL